MKKIWAVVILFFAVFISYAPAVRNGFVWDDTALVLRDPLIRSWRLIPEGFNHFLFLDATPSDFYRPLQRLTYTTDYAAFAFQPAGYHAISMLWHFLAVIAFFLFADEFLRTFGFESRRATWISFGTALIWAIHPVHSGAVVYISGRADPLAATFGFFGLFLLIRSERRAPVRQLVLLAAGGILLLCSALSRESGLIFPVLGLAFFIYRNNWTHLLKTLGVVAFVGVIYFSLRAGAEHYPPPRLTTPPPLLIRPIIIARAVAEYAGLIVFPLNLHVDRDVETQSTGLNEASFTRAALRELQTLLGIILIALFVYWLLRARKRNPAAFLSLVFALITYLPISGIATLNASVAEHWIYLPSAFLFLAAALQIDRAVSRTASHRIRGLLIPTIVAVWAIFLGVRTFLRTFDWKDQRTFLERTIASGGDSARMLINLGAFELNQGKFTDAAVHLHAALQKKPDQPLAILNLAAVALKQGDYKVARDLATRACQMPLVDAEAHQLLAIVESKENGKLDLMRMRLAAHTGPPNWPIEKRYIQLLAEAGADKGAVDELLTCLQTQWYRADSWKLLSELHAKLGHATQAANALAQAREYDVHLSSAALN